MIVTNDEQMLRSKCMPCLPEEVDGLVKLLEEELNKSEQKGIGLAAIQIGIPKQIAIVRISEKHSVNLVNCRIANGYDEILFKDEGCLSIPGKRIDTVRFNEIHVVDNAVYPHSFIATGLFAVCVQHEMDHMNGKIIEDRKFVKVVKQPPNEKCKCQSGLKFKKCCGGKRMPKL